MDWNDQLHGFVRDTDHPEPEPLPPLHRETYEGRVFGWAGARQRHIDANECPLPGCHRELDSEGACPGCGWSLLEEQLKARVAASEKPLLPEPPVAVDEYAQAQIDEAA